jgi:hypothetical protein
MQTLRLFVLAIASTALTGCLDDNDYYTTREALGSTTPDNNAALYERANNNATENEEAAMGPKAYDEQLRAQAKANEGK